MTDRTIRTYKLNDFLEWFHRGMKTDGLFVETCQVESNTNITFLHRADHFVFILVTKGEMVSSVNLQKYHIKQQCGILNTPDTIRQSVSVSPDCEASFFAFDVNYLVSAGIYEQAMDIFSYIPYRNSPLLELDDAEFELISDMIRLLERKLNTPPATLHFEKIIHHLFAGIVFELGAMFSKRRYTDDFKGSRKAELTSQFMDMLKQYAKTERTVIDYANRLNITPNHLSQTVREVTGRTAGELIDEVVLMEACLLLNNVSLSISEVATTLNFKDQFMFSKYFKKLSGKSPRDYRKQ